MIVYLRGSCPKDTRYRVSRTPPLITVIPGLLPSQLGEQRRAKGDKVSNTYRAIPRVRYQGRCRGTFKSPKAREGGGIDGIGKTRARDPLSRAVGAAAKLTEHISPTVELSAASEAMLIPGVC